MTQKHPVEFIEEKKIEKGAYSKLVVAIPEIGLVGLLAAKKLVDDLKMRRVGYIMTDALSMMIKYENSKPEPMVRIYAYNDFLVLLYEAPPEFVLPVANFVADFISEKEIDLTIMLASAPSSMRMEKSEDEILILAAPVGKEAEDVVARYEIRKLVNGVLSGPYALVLNRSIKEGRNALVLLAETFHVPMIDPASAAVLLRTVSKILGVEDKVNIRELIEKAEEIKLQMRKLEEAMRAPAPKEIGMLYT